MDSFSTWILRGLNEKQGKSRLSRISDLIDANSLHPRRDVLEEMSSKRCMIIRVRRVEDQIATLF